MKISIIAAISENRGLGKNNQLLFKIPEDFKRMKALTTGHPIIMGRKTYESIGRPLPNRTNIVITRDVSFDPHKFCSSEKCDASIIVCNSLDEALRQAQGKPGSGEIFIFGGGEIFKQAMPIVDRLYLTIVKKTVDADTFFPDYSMFTRVLNKEDHKTDDGLRYSFFDLER